MTKEQMTWLDYHRKTGSPYGLMMTMFMYEHRLSKEEAERIVEEYAAAVGPSVARQYRLVTAVELGAGWALILFVILFAPVALGIKFGLFMLAAVTTGVRLKCQN